MKNIPDILKLEHYFDFSLADYRDLFDGCEYAWDAVAKLQEGRFADKLARRKCVAVGTGGEKGACRVTGAVKLRVAKGARIDPLAVITGEDGSLVSIDAGAELLPGAVISAGGCAVCIGKGVSVGPNAHIDASAGSVCIGEGAALRHGAYVRGLSLVSAGAVIGNSCEIKCSLIGREAEVPHFNYVGDSLLGFKAHLGAGVKISNLKITPAPAGKDTVKVKCGQSTLDTGLRKLGAVIGDRVQIGCNSVCNPGTFIGKNTLVYTGCNLAGIIPADSIVKLRQTFERIDIRR